MPTEPYPPLQVRDMSQLALRKIIQEELVEFFSTIKVELVKKTVSISNQGYDGPKTEESYVFRVGRG